MKECLNLSQHTSHRAKLLSPTAGKMIFEDRFVIMDEYEGAKCGEARV